MIAVSSAAWRIVRLDVNYFRVAIDANVESTNIRRIHMDTRLQENEGTSVAALVAPEDLRRGDFVTVLSEIVELPSFLWCEMLATDRSELVRLRRLPTDDRAPMKVKAICLPFIFVKLPKGQFRTIDIRLTSLVRLEKNYARTVWKTLKPPATKRRTTC